LGGDLLLTLCVLKERLIYLIKIVKNIFEKKYSKKVK